MIVFADLPTEIQYLSIQDKKAFTSMLKYGHFFSYAGKIMCVGHEAVGKTAITSVLKNETPCKIRKSTEGIDVHIHKAAVDMKKLTWVPKGEMSVNFLNLNNI